MAILSCPFKDKITKVLSGDGPGADQFGIRWAEKKGIPVERFPAEWNNFELPLTAVRRNFQGKKYNAAAGIYRTHEMINRAEGYISSWNRISPGTQEGIQYALSSGLVTHVFCYTCEKCYTMLTIYLRCPRCNIRYQSDDLIWQAKEEYEGDLVQERFA